MQTDPETGKTVGWEPVGQSAFAKFFEEARERLPGAAPGTYELCGPEVNGDPEQLGEHRLVPMPPRRSSATSRVTSTA
ncbi:hypothetical protein AB0F52_43180 [Amycolatopsis sp. NPDC024027]|uniref:hypothetical protein n=1 Tax=Amycolatopsis sp. NPDC024027 TaxID=3154327 RepID=UPI0033EA036F